MRVSQWADQYGLISQGANVGRWKCLPFQVAILDALANPRVREVTFMKSARLGWTEMLKLSAGYYIHHAPSSILFIQPTVDLAKSWAKNHIDRFIADCEVLRSVVVPAKSRDSEASTLQEKRYGGGEVMYLRGANAASGLAMVSAKFVAFDETDRYPVEIADEGDPVELGKQRNTTYWDSITAYGSTPTTKFISKIERISNEADLGWFVLRCSECGCDHVRLFREPEQPVVIRGVTLPVSILTWHGSDWRSAAFGCPECGVVFSPVESERMIQVGRWFGHRWEWDQENLFQFHAPDRERLHLGFKLWAGYSPHPDHKPDALAREFLRVKDAPDKLRIFVNTKLGEVWESAEEVANPSLLYQRRESYPAECPAGVLMLTAGVDVQINRVEVSVYGWGVDQESWLIQHEIIEGDTSLTLNRTCGVWYDLYAFLSRRWKCEGGGDLGLAQTLVDSGYQTQNVYDFCQNAGRHVSPSKGSAGELPIVEDRRARLFRMRKLDRRLLEVMLERIGVDGGKTMLYGRYAIRKPGSGYVHFPFDVDEEFFSQLTAEVKDIKYEKGQKRELWVLPSGRRNEALDCAVLALAAMFLRKPDFASLEKHRRRWLEANVSRETSGG